MKRLAVTMVSLMSLLCCVAQSYNVTKDISYRPTATDAYAAEMCRLDVASFEGAEGRPVVVWFHGGGLTGGARELPAELLRDSVVVVGVEYRLSPGADIPEIIDDAAAAVAWTVANIADYGGDPSKVFIAGHSAGGYLVDMIGFNKDYLARYGVDADSLAGIIPFSGQCITHFELRRRRGIDNLQPVVDEFAPLFHVRPDCPPVLIVSGDREMELYGRYEEQAYMWRMFKLVGHPDVTLYELDGYDHGGMARPAFPLLLRFVKARV